MKRSVIRLDAQSKTAKTYESIAEAARDSFVSEGCVKHHCAGRHKNLVDGRYQFLYADEVGGGRE